MPFDARVFQLAKDPQQPGQCQDAWRIDAARGRAAAADGVSAAIFSGPWANILVEAAVADPLPPGDASGWEAWLAPHRRRWAQQINADGLTWNQRAKLAAGAFSTLLWLWMELRGDREQGIGNRVENGALQPVTCNLSPPKEYDLHVGAAGDTCLLHVRQGRLLKAFPRQRSADFDDHPPMIGSYQRHRDQFIQTVTWHTTCREGDLLIVATDAVAAWALAQFEQAAGVDWDAYFALTDAQWRAEVTRLREARLMHYDDATLLLLRPAAVARVVEPAADSASNANETPAVVSAAAVPPPQSASLTVPSLEPKAADPPAPSSTGPSVSPTAAGPPAAEPSVESWTDNVVSLSESVAGQIADSLLGGLRKFKAAVRKYQDKLPPRDEPPAAG